MRKLGGLLLVASLEVLAACSNDAGGGSAGDVDLGSATAVVDERYLLGSIVFGDEGSNGYVNVLPASALDGGSLSLEGAREFPGQSDVWLRNGFVYVASGDAPKVTKYEVESAGDLRELGSVSFADYGVTDAAFWNHLFVSDEKAYLTNGPEQLVVWNPKTMRITGTIDLPSFTRPGNLVPRLGTADRTGIVRDGMAYLTVYWTDDDYADRAGDSLILVFDTNDDALIDQVSVACPGLDYGTSDDEGNVYFSNWTGGVGTYYVLGTAQNCIAKLDVTSRTHERIFFADLTGGHEGAAFAYAGDGAFVFSVFDEVRAKAAETDDPFAILSEPNFRLYRYEPGDGEAVPVDGVDWNSGACIHVRVGAEMISLVPGAGYADTTGYRLEGASATKAYDVTGWSFRLFAL
ncbi:MAG: hypothetical protein RL385_832 [Pseudomonadota bacterium]|jgi:hypothetical protein